MTTTVPCDPYFANVKLLVTFDGDNNSKVFTDYSLTNKTPQRVENVIITNEQKVFGSGGSGKYEFDVSTNPHLTYGPSSDFDLSGNWTLDFNMFIKPGRPVESSSDDEYFMSISHNQYFRLDTKSSPCLHCTWFGVMGSEINGVAGPLSPGAWYHFALVHKENNEWYFYVNGNLTVAGVGYNDGGGGSGGD